MNNSAANYGGNIYLTTENIFTKKTASQTKLSYVWFGSLDLFYFRESIVMSEKYRILGIVVAPVEDTTRPRSIPQTPHQFYQAAVAMRATNIIGRSPSNVAGTPAIDRRPILTIKSPCRNPQ